MTETVQLRPAWCYVALMAGQQARPLKGRFNNIPVLHSNQPEIVGGPGILVNSAPGSAIATETNRPLKNASFTFNGEFGVHVHHKYYPKDTSKLGGTRARGLLTVATIAINPGGKPVTLTFEKGSVKNSFEAPYHPNHLMGVKPLGPRPWNTGPGDATSVQMLRSQLDRKLTEMIVIPPGGRKVIFSTMLPARGIANGLLKGKSDGPFQMAVVAAEETNRNRDLIAVLDSGRLAPGRIYLKRIREIESGRVFSRVAGVALGDRYQASIRHDLQQGALHVPLTSTHKHNFGTREVQVNPLTTRMIDSAVNNVGTYGVRFDVTMHLHGSGPHQLVMSHPVVSGKKRFTAFRGSIGIESHEGYKEVHVGLRSGESLPLSDLTLKAGVVNPVKVSLVYPADATPGHLLSVVPVQQMAVLKKRQQMIEQARLAELKRKKRNVNPAAPPPTIKTANKPATEAIDKAVIRTGASRPLGKRTNPLLPAHRRPIAPPPPPALVSPAGGITPMTPAVILPPRINSSLEQRYREAIKAQQEWLDRFKGR
ncbi:MAG: DUF3370 family protein [Prochlorococcus sp.]|nr:DUF3370 family protein [Prochlorococcaceae cyanobacterium Fu_MAG_50]